VRMELIFDVSETCDLIGGYQCFGMNVLLPSLGSSETLVTTYKTAGLRRHIPEDPIDPKYVAFTLVQIHNVVQITVLSGLL
jgi:hypothetical protein